MIARTWHGVTPAAKADDYLPLMLTVQQKIAGSFRADSSGAEAFARIRSYCATLRKQGVALVAALQTVFLGQPRYPAVD
jgi:hypothetical protein